MSVRNKLHYRKLEKLRGLGKNEDGNVESALVLVPLLVLFLIAIELVVATNLRNSDFALAQGDATRRAISGQLLASDRVIELNSPDSFAHMKLLISHRKHSLPQLVPGLIALLGGKAVVEVNGVALMETIN
ncbi:MAG: hypothetical protein F2690_03480 [Actinobacteria bacterium]|nr:hypothetical protein [Actinomycetota bacterium]MSX72092.1 hypothetical protein [Actinomycetota bacterium]MSY69612.1 hypothetical protein [Actinomycetota bacterium]MTA76115.1 hypothetical protein [Actinomycetota bacterium]